MMMINGDTDTRINVLDRGLQYGDGLFETVLLHDHSPVLWPAHLQRLLAGARRLGIPVDGQQLEEEVGRFLSAHSAQYSDIPDGILKVIVTRGSGGRGYRPPDSPETSRILQWHPLPPDLTGQQRDGIAVTGCCQPVSINPALAGLKHLNRLDQVMASRELQPPFEEGLMCDPDGLLVEGTRSNVFLVQNGVLQTPSVERSGVAGIIRAALLEMAANAGVDTAVITAEARILLDADEVFVCNSIAGILPVRQLVLAGETRLFAPGATTRTLQHWLEEHQKS